MKKTWFQRGFTLSELVVVIGVLSTLLGIVILNLANAHSRSSVNSTVTQLVADIKEQQNRAMTGDTASVGTNRNFGIYFQAGSYTLFHGASYVAGDTSNLTINLDNGAAFSTILFPSSQIVFAEESGEINGFVNGSDSIIVRNNAGNDQKTIKLNRYGVITSIN